ncbi:MAG: FAD-dependent 5-carboxymethylaminomethyl-2-thiouridine(34) oxidoreductase MnmC [Methylotenera sp.]|nr:FAD-dependent 5-carboxymethylaminomethyl-2-thiouridine(34) oxidoreductase MnmC [Methylotenera sp.]
MPNKSVLIIGGGIAGCSSAYALAKRGVKVTLIEQHDGIATEASGNPQAMLYPRLSGGDSASQFALACYLFSLDLLAKLQLQADDFHACGMLQLGFNDRELARLQKVLAWPEAAKHLRLLNQDEASQQAGMALLHPALYFPHAAWLNPQALCQSLIAHGNITVKTSVKITRLLKKDGVFEVYAGDSCLEKSPTVVLANANQAQNLGLGLQLKIHAVRGQLSFVGVSPLSASLRTIVCSDGYLSPASQGRHSLGASFSQDGSAALDELDQQANLSKLNSYAKGLYGSLKNNLQGGRVSFRCSSADYFPLLGELLDHPAVSAQPPRPNAHAASLPWSEGLYVNLAHGSRGFTSAPYCGEILAGLICRENLAIDPAMLSRLNPNRFLLRQLGLKKLARNLPSVAASGMHASLG